MSKSNEALKITARRFLVEFKDADQQTKEELTDYIQMRLSGKLSPGGKRFIEELFELLLTGEPNDVAKYLGLIS
ncbi:hypothetical protein ACLI5Y_13350 [Enterococcus innesii]|uniref:hypothetical protein n=1 Tax=Enterococcus innesii TaxID=2839759 RepID=UPI0039854E01